MRVLKQRLAPRSAAPKHPRKYLRYLAFGGAVLLIIYSALFIFRFTRPLPLLTPEAKSLSVAPKQKDLHLPLYGQAAVGAVGYGQLAKAGDDIPRPTASVAKVLTALTVLDKKPIAKGQSGPVLTLDAIDVAFYEDYLSKNGSIVAVQNGEGISEYQALQALLLPSANNMAASLARWSYGSLDDFLVAANNYARSHGLQNTTMADASGFSPQTVSTASDLIKLGELALQQPIIAEIIGQSSAVLPVAGEVHNVNALLGTDGIDGIKTGNTDEAGGCFLTTMNYKHASGSQVRLVVAVMGAKTLAQAMHDARQLLDNTTRGFGLATLKKGTVAGYYNVPWGERLSAVIKEDITVFRWQGTVARADVSLHKISGFNQDGAGDITLVAGPAKASAKLELLTTTTSAPWRWRTWRAIAL